MKRKALLNARWRRAPARLSPALTFTGATLAKAPQNETYESGPSGQGAGQSRRDANGEHVYGWFVWRENELVSSCSGRRDREELSEGNGG